MTARTAARIAASSPGFPKIDLAAASEITDVETAVFPETATARITGADAAVPVAVSWSRLSAALAVAGDRSAAVAAVTAVTARRLLLLTGERNTDGPEYEELFIS